MIDIHSHILPGLDDGSPDLETSLRMARMALKDGISHVIATPHVRQGLGFGEIRGAALAFQKVLDGEGLPLRVYAGGEIPFDMLRFGSPSITLGGSRYVLVEFLPQWIPEDAETVFGRMLREGYRPVIAHPERNRVFMQHPELLKNLMLPGVALQVTAMGLKGSFGPSVKFFAHALLRQGLVDFIATDAHDDRLRKPELSFLLTSGKNRKHDTLLRKILYDNPGKILCDGCSL